jgi:hypothetical protein|tara:strand:- start:860 stop:2254 length:1395 start_codon:yes stop_codon:yes gene_type:complete
LFLPNDEVIVENLNIDVITAPEWINCENKLGQYMEDSDYDILIENDTDFYSPAPFGEENSENNIIFKYRRNVFTEEEQLGAYDGLIEAAAVPTQNRGLAAGTARGKQGGKDSENGRDWVTACHLEVLDHYINERQSLFDDGGVDGIIAKHEDLSGQDNTRGMVWLRTKVTDAGYNYSTFFTTKVAEWKAMPSAAASKDASIIRKTYISDTTYANAVNSGIAGFFDRYPRIPYGRATAYTDHNRERYEKCYPFMRKLSNKFEEYLPERYLVQKLAADQLDSRYRVVGDETPFTTVTVNKNFRTAAHRDAGDLTEGFSNLTVVAKGDQQWTGGYLVLPEFRVAINIRPGDLLLINNHAGIHGNTELLPPEGKKLADMERISLVCYFRENMLKLGSWEYEATRKDFVEHRRLNKEHRFWKHLWNGVSPSMWESDEWYQYLEERGGRDMLLQYHPEAIEEKTSLESFF